MVKKVDPLFTMETGNITFYENCTLYHIGIPVALVICFYDIYSGQ